MARFAFLIEYDGGPFVGWQRQDGQASVQGTVEAALARLEPGDHTIAAAGRTDAGVHATGQVAHADLTRDWAPSRLRDALNFHLRPAPVAVLECAIVPDDFHARFSALERAYTYRFLCRRPHAVLDRGQVWRVGRALDIGAMREGAAHLVGQHDFTTFRASNCQAKSPVKTVDSITFEELVRPGGTEIRMQVRARSFLHHQVRSFAGTLERVGAGAWRPEHVAEVLAACDRRACGPVAPPAGLCMTGVTYTPDPFPDPPERIMPWKGGVGRLT